ncbi:unnamed protein product [Periconia digitata]|uniref:Uncharacterized protein n=1 Tax=Periconia digitata TaxID=1303443 RepID=A0A9W4UIT7_9PLEO|nr:unnamed protein product [Periconia digitata]
MFSRVFNTARQILSRSPSAQRRSEERIEEESAYEDAEPGETMVTTRSGTGTDPSVESTPRSSVKTRGKRELDHDETPTATKKRRKSGGASKPQSESDEGIPTKKPESKDSQHVASGAQAVTIPDRTVTESKSPAQAEPPSSVRRGNPRVVIPKKPSTPSTVTRSAMKKGGEAPSATQEPEFYTPGSHVPSPEFVTPAMYRDSASSPTPKATKILTTTGDDGAHNSTTLEVYTRSEVPSSSLNSETAPISSQESIPALPQKKIHKRFDSEEPEVIPAQTIADQPAEPAEVQTDDIDDDASDSDEAPEMVATATAASKIKAKDDEAARAQKAIEDRDARRKQKRAERKAEEQAEKRKREEAKAEKLAKQQAKEERRREKQEAAASSRKEPPGFNMSSLPALLPDSVLEAVGSHRPPTPPPVRTGRSLEQIRKDKLQRHIKFLDQGEKPIKDVKRGSVNVSVLAKQNKLLAPKVGKSSKGIREHWLKGRHQEKVGRKGNSKAQFRKMERKAVGGGFLRGDDE